MESQQQSHIDAFIYNLAVARTMAKLLPIAQEDVAKITQGVLDAVPEIEAEDLVVNA